ncbi:hybrid sensor histidine kinase/response regulator transcription factor [Sunxiuqinia indica]|uniref:hybrid sensor histidine kinase/response regulator transcription factor n=1 Tax=Sunxiuqinia indica TaxID=2692584 RepID=UPI00135C71B9|nr:hybrid sensor histidine kinase/response regulator transcription factor [Sunxiuqinia indica]
MSDCLLKKNDSKIANLLLALLLIGIMGFANESQVNTQYKFMHLTINDGLSNNQVRSILKDSQGFMWFGTGRGLNRFDGLRFKTYKHDPYDSTSIPFNAIDFLSEDSAGQIWIKSVNDFAIFNPQKETFSSPDSYLSEFSIPLISLYTIFNDQEGNTWFVNNSSGLYRLNDSSRSVTVLKHQEDDPTSISSNSMMALNQDSKGNFWAISSSGMLEKLDRDSLHVSYRIQLNAEFKSAANNYRIFIDSEDDVWVYSLGQPYGAFLIDTSTGNVLHVNTKSEKARLNNDLVSSIVEDEEGMIWLATDHGGINRVDKNGFSVIYVTNNPDDKYSLIQNSVNYLYKDSQNIIWAGTYKKGVSYYHQSLIRFDHYRHVPSISSSLPFNDVNCFVEDKKGNLWIGTNGGGLLYFNRKTGSYRVYRNDSSDPNSLSNNIIVSLFIDRNDQLWIGTYFGGLDRFDGRVFHHHRHDPDNPASLSDNRVWEIFEDSKRNLWIGTLAGGLELYDRERGVFYHYASEDMNSVGSNFIMSIMEDSESNLWLGTSDGVDRLNLLTKRFEHFTPEPGVPGRLSDKNALGIHEDARGLIWIATPEGLNLYSKHENQFRVFTEKDGLPDSNVKTILEDEQGNLWIGTTNGVSKIEITNFSGNPEIDQLEIQTTNYDMMDGLQGKEFNENAAYRTKAGELIFGGANGFNLFKPENLEEQKLSNEVVLTNLKVFNREVPVGTPIQNRIILDKSITQQDKITLRHSENVFSLGFTSLNFFQPEKNSFEYKLEGFNEAWLKTDPQNAEATFTNLNAGEYAFHVRVSNDGGKSWQVLTPPLKIEITPPFWKSNYAFGFYVLFIVGLLLLARRILVERERLKFAAEQEHQEAERIHQLDGLKTKFFTNISHEFRTPLSLILSPIERLIGETKDEKLKAQLKFIHRHARRLLAMVNQLLDFRKMEVQQIEAKENWGDLIGFIKEVGLSFQDLAANKGIKFRFKAEKEDLFTYFDQDKVEKVISNLLSNAFKFTPEKGKITLRLKYIESDVDSENSSQRGTVLISVKDNGIGIPVEKQERIFDRFFQDDLPNSFVNQGSGIGLSLVNDYVKILGGTIRVESIVDKGSVFEVALPVQLFSQEQIDLKNQSEDSKEPVIYYRENRAAFNDEVKSDSTKKNILLVEDNEDFRFYLKDNLKEHYNVYEAGNGKIGWEMTLKKLPDLIVSDVVMPEMDGIEFCSKIKGDGRTAHVPLILLTAKVDTDPTLEGFQSGADDYISKPFDFRILESRIENLINSREQLRRSYQSMIGMNPEKIKVTSQDEKFLIKALGIVEKNLDNTKFSVENLSKEIGMSRVSLYKKLTLLTTKSPVEFIRIIRLRRAADFMENSELTVSEIAYACGFNSPRYFSKYFKAEYKELPSEYINNHRKKQNSFQMKL